MRALFFGFLIFALWISFTRYYFVCELRGHCGDKQELVDDKARAKTLSLAFEDETILEGYDQFYFKEGISKPTLNDNNYAFLDSLASYMFDNEDKNLKITGHYLVSEKDIDNGIYENIGFARANSIRQALVDVGVEPDRISIDAQADEGDVLKEPITFELVDRENSEYTPIQYTFEDMTISDVNFESDSDVFTPLESFLTYADTLAIYFEQYPDRTLTIEGHCDATGSEPHNNDLGKRRAESAKKFLVDENGITAKITTVTKGEKVPTATNKTKQGRAKNRRVRFIIE